MAVFGEDQFKKQLAVSIGSHTTQGFLELCNAIVQFSIEEPVNLTNEREILLSTFLEAIRNESDTEKILYLFYLPYVELRYFAVSTKQFLQQHFSIQEEDRVSFIQKILELLQPQFEFMTKILKHLYNKLDISFNNKLGGAFGSEFGSVFGSVFDSAFGRVFDNQLSTNIFTNTWSWIVWLCYCQHLPQTYANSMYFKSISTFHFNYFVSNAKTVFEIIEKQELSVLYENLSRAHNALPIGRYLYVEEITQKNDVLICTLTLETDGHKTISRESALHAYYNQIGSRQRIIFCPEIYRSLGTNSIGIFIGYDSEYYFRCNLYILLPGNIENTAFFKVHCSKCSTWH